VHIFNPFSLANRRFCLAWLVLISLIAGAGADPAIATNSIPTRLKISAGTFFGTKLVLELHDGGDLILRTTPGRGQNIESVIALHPSADKWRTFRTSLDSLSVWSWKPDYVDTAAPTDGYSWQVELTYPDRKLVSHGYEAAPTHDGSSSTYSDFTKAVSYLIDQPFE